MSEPARAVFLSYASQDAGAARRICDSLRAAGAALDRLAARLAAHEGALQAKHAGPLGSVYEFHAEAGAPEGALYVDGLLVGRLEGVLRL